MDPCYRRGPALGAFQVLSDELICIILEFLEAKDLGTLACVSSVFYIFCNEDTLYMKLYMRNFQGLLRYGVSWKQTLLEKLKISCQHVSHTSVNMKLHFDGFSSLFLYRRWYRCNVDLSAYRIDSGAIDKRHVLSYEEFHSSYDGKKPVLIDNLADSWPAMQKWSTDYLVKKYGKCVFKVAEYSGNKVKMSLEDYASYMVRQHDEDPLYIFDPKFGKVAPELVEDYEVPDIFKEDLFELLVKRERPPFRWLVIGPARSGASWHVDPALTSAWNTLISGCKRWALYPPGHVPPSVVVHADIEDGDVDIDSPTSLQWWLDVYPGLKPEDRPLECIQVPGETMFVPSGWWHSVLNIETSVAVTQNFVNSTNMQLVCLDLTPGFCHKGVSRAGRLAVLEHAYAKIHPPFVNGNGGNGDVIMKGDNKVDWRFDVDFLASFIDRGQTNCFLSAEAGFINSHLLRKWLHKLWRVKPTLRDKTWKSACIAYDAENWLERVKSICNSHGIPLPTEEEQLPMGYGTNPVFLVGGYFIKLYLDEESDERSIDVLSSELQFYNELKNSGSKLKHAIPSIVGSGIVYEEKSNWKAIPWDGTITIDLNCSNGNQKIKLSSNFERARWNRAIVNPSFLEVRQTNSIEDEYDSGISSCYPYIISARCEGKELCSLRSRMEEPHFLAVARLLGEYIHELHSLPLPECSVTNAVDEKSRGDGDSKEKRWSCKVRNEWCLFVSMIRRQRNDVVDRLRSWDCVPPHLLSQIEDYLPDDPVILAGIKKISDGVAVMDLPVWLHMDVNEENILLQTSLPSLKKDDSCDSGMCERIKNILGCYIIDFGDVCLGDPLYEVISIYLDVFRGDKKLLKKFLGSYKHPLSSKSLVLMQKRLSYRAMCYSILHEENCLGAIFSIWEELQTAGSWDEIETKVWGFLNGCSHL